MASYAPVATSENGLTATSPRAARCPRRFLILASSLFLFFIFVFTFLPSSSSTASFLQPKRSTITLITGTHTSSPAFLDSKVLSEQPPVCDCLADALFQQWTTSNIVQYNNFTSQIEDLLDSISKSSTSCILHRSNAHSSLLSFPISFLPLAKCDRDFEKLFRHVESWFDHHNLPVDFYLFRPDIVKLSKLTDKKGIQLKVHAFVDNDLQTSSLHMESQCQRYKPITSERSLEPLLWTQLTHLQAQTRLLRDSKVDFSIIDCHKTDSETELQVRDLLQVPSALCIKHEVESKRAKISSLFSTIETLPLFSQQQKLVKTRFHGPLVVFVAGVEGVGHHALVPLAEPFLFAELRSALKTFLTNNPHSIAGWDTVVFRLHQLKNGLHFLNPDLEAGNVYSFPFGVAHDCEYKKVGRSICFPDLVSLARAGEKGKVDFRILLLERTFGADLVADSVHRHLSSTFEQAKVLVTAQSILASSFEQLDEKFFVRVKYEDTLGKPKLTAKELADKLRVSGDEKILEHFIKTFEQNRQVHGVVVGESEDGDEEETESESEDEDEGPLTRPLPQLGPKDQWAKELKKKFWEFVLDMQSLFVEF